MCMPKAEAFSPLSFILLDPDGNLMREIACQWEREDDIRVYFEGFFYAGWSFIRL